MSKVDEQDLHRLVKQALDSGAAATVAEAEARFRGYRLAVTIGADEARQLPHQIALLTAVALGRRVFHGGVQIAGPLGVPLMAPLPLGATLADAVVALGGAPLIGPHDERPTIAIDDKPLPPAAEFHVRTAFAGWRGGVLPADAAPIPERPVMALAPMLSAALAVNEAFARVADRNAAAGRRRVGLSLWDLTSDWLAPDGAPELELVPSRLWILGLGHLGQAYLWALGVLPVPADGGLELVLQDTDVISRSTESTSILTDASMVGTRKTRAMTAWAERRGFRTAIYERAFDTNFRRQSAEPAIALCGIDNAIGRQALDDAGFSLVVEAGLGRGHRDFRTMRLHSLPASRRSAEMWTIAPTGEDVTTRPAYQRLLADGALDRCGVTLLAGKAVGAPFVGAVAATLVISQVLRLLHGAPLDGLVDLDLQSVEHRLVVAQPRDFSSLNPGYLRVR
ncbi:hypothetical protein [Sandaracinus amylolyticus]|uniref:hypothetical protein n=1 Tax=Sandaracinus amylolyticus TaxID=927083 RepID=UPI001F1B2864|nr:hypothetical protein [Sandaracinus amylolyticus]UJR83674.1 Hypothetical protein I5071_57430 [Sandaracinus amylolyticus]